MAEPQEKPTAFAVFATVLARWDTERLEQAAADVATLADHPGYRVMFQVLGEKREKEVARLVHGGVLAHETYAAITGTLSGLDQVLHVAEAVLYANEQRRIQERAEAAEAARSREADAA